MVLGCGSLLFYSKRTEMMIQSRPLMVTNLFQRENILIVLSGKILI